MILCKCSRSLFAIWSTIILNSWVSVQSVWPLTASDEGASFEEVLDKEVVC